MEKANGGCVFEAAEDAKARGLIKDYIVVYGDGTQNQQIAQLNSLILSDIDAICIMQLLQRP